MLSGSSASEISKVPSTTASRGGVNLVEVIASGATVLRKGQLSPWSPNTKATTAELRSLGRTRAEQQPFPAAIRCGPASAATAPKTVGSLRRFGNTNRTMSYRGESPRLVKVRVVAKVDSKSYFSAERTMYRWMYIGTSVIGYGLSLLGYHAHIDAAVRDLACKSALLLACLGMCVAYYASAYFYRRRDALMRMSDAAVFDERLAPATITILIIAVFTIYAALSWMNHDPTVVPLKHSSFGVQDPYHKPRA